MKTTIPKLKRLIREEFKRILQEGDIDMERRRNYGYDEVDSGQGTEYHDLPESFEVETEDKDRLRRAEDGYGETEFEEELELEQPPATGAVAQRGAAYQQALEPRSVMQKGNEMAAMLMRMVGQDPQSYKAFATAMKKNFRDHPLARALPSSLAPQAPAAPAKEVNDPPGDEGKKKSVKKKKGKGHAAPSSHESSPDTGRYPGPPAGGGMVSAGYNPSLKESPGYDPVSGRDPKASCPFDKSMHVPVQNMSDPEDTPDVPLFDTGVEMPSLSQVSEKDLPSQEKAKKIMKHGEIGDKPLTKKQKGLFGLLAGGEEPTKMKDD